MGSRARDSSGGSGETSIEGDTEYAFLHVLVRDVAYGQIPRSPRSEKHRLTARWIEALGRPEDHAEMVAYHYREALLSGVRRASTRRRTRIPLGVRSVKRVTVRWR